MKLKEYITKNRMTVSEFCWKAKIPEVSIYRYLRGKKPSMSSIRRIESATENQVTVEDFENP